MNNFKIKTPATSANLGPGFDILGVSLNLYNIFEVKESDKFAITGCNEKYDNENNTFFTAYKKTAEVLNLNKKCEVIAKCDIPFSHGLGSSASLIVAGVLSANEIAKQNNNPKILDENEVFKIATTIEDHPDNIAPCLFGGLTISIEDNGQLLYKKISIDKNFYPTVFIPSYNLSTEEARKVVPTEITRKDSIYNTSHALLLIEALRSGDENLLKISQKDKIHVPYRKSLIKEYDMLNDVCIKNGALSFTISGAGPTMITISTNPQFSKKLINYLPSDIKVLDLIFTNEGSKVIN